MRKIVWMLMILCLLTVPAQGVQVEARQAELFGAEDLEKNLPRDAEALLEDYSPTEQADLGEAVEKFSRMPLEKAAGPSDLPPEPCSAFWW